MEGSQAFLLLVGEHLKESCWEMFSPPIGIKLSYLYDDMIIHETGYHLKSICFQDWVFSFTNGGVFLVFYSRYVASVFLLSFLQSKY